MTVEEIAAEIRSLDALSLSRLIRLIEDDPGWGAITGVREPRRPAPTSDSARAEEAA